MKFKVPLLLFSVCFAVLSCERKPYRQGEILYQNFCANCHMDDGSGLAGNIPPLAGADFVRQNQDQMACIIRYGLEGGVVVNGIAYQNPMAGIPQLSEFEIANIINYINQAWGNDYGYLPLKNVRESLEGCGK